MKTLFKQKKWQNYEKGSFAPSWSLYSLFSGGTCGRSSGASLLPGASRWAAEPAGSSSSRTWCKHSPASARPPLGSLLAARASSGTAPWLAPSAQTRPPVEKRWTRAGTRAPEKHSVKQRASFPNNIHFSNSFKATQSCRFVLFNFPRVKTTELLQCIRQSFSWVEETDNL